ncbi:MAG TPA: FecR family protein [Verrucomicrobiae bacterium]|nr:FecR family protein [Verrucomicrobiae bacterium]
MAWLASRVRPSLGRFAVAGDSITKTNSHPARSLCAALLVLAFVVAAAVADSVDVSPNSAVGNTPITVTASGFDETGNMAVFFYLDTPSSFEQPGYWGVCFGSGSCQIQASMPLEAGPHTVYAYGYQNAFAQEQFTVLTPVFMLDHSCLTNGTPLIMTGDNFAQGANINLYLDGSDFLGQGHTDSAGRFATKIALGLPNGSHSITAYNGGGEIAGSQTFVVGSNNCPKVGQVLDLTGQPTITHPGGQPQPLNPNDPVQPGDVIETGAGQHVNILLSDDTQFTVSENARITIDEYVYDPSNGAGDQGQYSFVRGAMEYTSGLIDKHDDNVRVNTAYGVLGIRGTKFIAQKAPCSTTQEVYLIEGELAITPQNTVVTNIVDAPATIQFDASTVITSALTQATYDALEAGLTNPATFASWQVQYFGCTNNNPAADPSADPDGDGQNNMAEFLTGTDPTNAASAFRILGVTRTNADLNVAWLTHTGITNVVEVATDLTGTFTNLSPNLIIAGVTNSSDVVTNYLDPGAATNSPSRYYRVRLVP